jgi:hypothetical protein
LQNDFSLAASKEVRGSVVLFYRLLRRFIRGEEAHPELFDFSIAALDELLAPKANRRLLDLVVQVRVLAKLGYVNEAAIPEEVRTCPLSSILAEDSTILMKRLETLVGKATESSHL